MIVLSSLFLWLAIFFWIKYQSEKKTVDSFVSLHWMMLESYSNWVDYALCIEDYHLWNIQRKSCEKFLEDYVEDVDFLKREFWLKTKYNYIWE